MLLGVGGHGGPGGPSRQSGRRRWAEYGGGQRGDVEQDAPRARSCTAGLRGDESWRSTSDGREGKLGGRQRRCTLGVGVGVGVGVVGAGLTRHRTQAGETRLDGGSGYGPRAGLSARASGAGEARQEGACRGGSRRQRACRSSLQTAMAGGRSGQTEDGAWQAAAPSRASSQRPPARPMAPCSPRHSATPGLCERRVGRPSKADGAGLRRSAVKR